MVGAGFSKNAILSAADTPKPPLWSDLAAKMASRLYPLQPDEAPRDPLRLAEEYRLYLGQAALDELIRTSIADEQWQPGPTHRNLLEFPWADVLTTNWDTLLERGAREVSARSYETVRSQADLPHARAPRIVKLHGSIGTNESFVLAEEDYRRYPFDQAAFVNLARQVFLENELCLIGFSGDDPNFLQWSGWVRDHLAGSARRIYLVGALNLGAAKRKFLEARNIAPIDLAQLASLRALDAADRPAAATREFLDFLRRSKPPAAQNWSPAHRVDGSEPFPNANDIAGLRQDPTRAKAVIERATVFWRKERQSYPGWLICPAFARRDMILATRVACWPVLALLGSPDLEHDHVALYELAWRHVTSFAPFDNSLAIALAAVAELNQVSGLPLRQRTEVACWLLDHHRQSGDDAAFDHLAATVELNSAEGTDERAAVRYHRLLKLRDNLDFNGLSESLGEPGGEDPVWMLRWAALHSDCGQAEEAERLVVSCLAELRRRQSCDRGSIWIRSRLAWAQWLSRANVLRRFMPETEEWPAGFREFRCDPWIELEGLERKVAEGLRKRRDEAGDIEPHFDVGAYSDRRATVHLCSRDDVEPLRTLERLMDTVGIPIRTGTVNLIGDIAQDAADLVFAPTAEWHLAVLRRMKGFSEASIDRHFGRLAVASLSADAAARIWTATSSTVDFWRGRLGGPGTKAVDPAYAEEQFRIDLELVSRLVARRGIEDGIRCMALARDIARQSTSLPWVMHEQIGNLLRRSQRAIGPFATSEAVLLALDFPLSIEAQAQADSWPNPIELLATYDAETGFERPKGDTSWSSRVNILLNSLRMETGGRKEAAVRLACLADAGLLTADERSSFGEGLWSKLEASGPPWPAGLALYPHIIARMPAPESYSPAAAARLRLFDAPLAPNDLERLSAIVAAAGRDSNRDPVLPDPAQAVRLFDEIAAIPPDESMPGTPLAMFGRVTRKNYEILATRAVGLSVVPGLRKEEISLARWNALKLLSARLPSGNILEALPYFADLGPEILLEVSLLLRRALSGRTSTDVQGAVYAVVTWARLSQSARLPPMPEEIVQRVVSAVEAAAGPFLNAHVWCARRLVELGRMDTQSQNRLHEALGFMLENMDYGKTAAGGEQAVMIPLARAECVRLAAALMNSGTVSESARAWLALAPEDPLPEVRHAAAVGTRQTSPHPN